MTQAKILERKKDYILRFSQRWGQDHFDLACHAAFPLAITPELLYCLRENFLPDISYIAIADLLLSPLCSRVADDLYEMDSTVRDLLLRRLVDDWRFGKERLMKLSEFMMAYINVQNLENPRIKQDLGLEPEWVALTYAFPQDAQKLRDYLSKKDPKEIHQRLVDFIDNQEDLLIAAGLEPIILSIEQELDNYGVILDPDPLTVEVVEFVETEETELETFSFETIFVNKRGEEVKRETYSANYYREPFFNFPSPSSHLILQPLDMIYIKGGTFWMGTDEEEIERLCKKFNWDGFRREKPQHRVTVPDFLMSKYPITQAQWKAVAELEPVERKLTLNPARFQDKPDSDNRPIERVSWYDAIEFCRRLSRETGKDYRLPTEAEWEYACRSVNSEQLTVNSEKLTLNEWNKNYHQPFYFGETITANLANYNGNARFANEPNGKYGQETTSVGQFPPNSFGLYDMHGNVWEWCEDDFQKDYNQHPQDGSAFKLEKSSIKVIRGGSWYNYPYNCCSVIRNADNPDYNLDNIGFRVVFSLI